MKRVSEQIKPARRAHVIIFASILIAAVVIRVVFLSQISSDELGGELSIDSEFYWELTGDILSGQGMPSGPLTFNPLYPIFLVAVFKLLGQSLLAARIVQSILGLATILVIYLTGSRIAGRTRGNGTPVKAIALIAMAVAVLYPQFLLYEGMLLGTTLEIFLLAASFALGLAIDDYPGGHRPLKIGSKRVPAWLGAGLLGAICGAGSLGRPNLFLLLTAALPVWIIARNLRDRRWLAPVLGFTAGAALFLLPPTIHNARHTGQFVPVTTHGGINFYIGNRPGTVGVYQPPDDIRGEMRGLVEDARAKAERETGRSMTDSEASDYFMQKTLSGIRNDPLGWTVLLGRKFVLFWNKIEVHDMPEVLYFQDSLPVFRIPLIPYSVIASLGLAGFLILMRSGRNRSIICLYLGVALFSVLLFYVNSRYRLPIVPVVIILAAYFVIWVFGEISKRRSGRAGVMLALTILIFLLVSNRTIVQANRGSVYTYLGTYYMNSGDESKAAEAFAEAYRIDPGRDTSMINYARVLMTQGRYQQAAGIYARAYALNPRYPTLAIEYAFTLQKLGRQDDARRIALDVFSSGPSEEKVAACKLLATAAFFEGDMEELARWVNAGLDIAPEDSDLRLMLESLERPPATEE